MPKTWSKKKKIVLNFANGIKYFLNNKPETRE